MRESGTIVIMPLEMVWYKELWICMMESIRRERGKMF